MQESKTSVPSISWRSLNGIYHVVETSWSDEFHTCFISPDQHSRERIRPEWFRPLAPSPTPSQIEGFHLDVYLPISFFSDWFLSDLLQTDLFQTWYNDGHHCIAWYQFEWPWHPFKITLYIKSRNLCADFLANFQIDLDEIGCAAMTYWVCF